jgi:hypothetical protein
MLGYRLNGTCKFSLGGNVGNHRMTEFDINAERTPLGFCFFQLCSASPSNERLGTRCG